MLGVPLTDPDRDPNCGSFLLQHPVHERGRERPPESASRMEPQGPLTSTTALRPVSQPMLRSVPGTLLLMVAGRMQMGMQNSWWRSHASANRTALSKA